MLPKVISTTATALGLVGDISIADTDLQVVIMGQLQAIVDQLTSNRQALENKISEMGISKIKMLFIERFSGVKLPLIVDQVVYAGLFLTGHALKQFKLYLMEYKANGLITRNNKVKYIFSSQEGFCNRLMQIYSNFKVIATAKCKLQELTQ